MVRLLVRMMVGLVVLGWTLEAAAIQTVGSVSSATVMKAPSGHSYLRVGLSNGGSMDVVPYAADMVRVRYHWAGLWDKDDIAIDRELGEWPVPAVSISTSGAVIEVATSNLVVEVVRSPNVQVHFRSPEGFHLSRDIRMEFNPDYQALNDPTYANLKNTGAMPAGFKVKAIRRMPAGEAYFGLGPNAGSLNRRGRNIQGWNSDAYGWQEHSNPLYMTMPFMYGVQGASSSNPPFAYGLFFNNPARPAFRFGTQWADAYSFEAGDGQVDYFFFGGGPTHAMKDVLARYTELTGKPTMLPKWAFGYHQSRWSYDSQGWVQWLADEFRRQDFPLDALYLDIDYMDAVPDNNYTDGTLHQLTFNRNFPDPAGLIRFCEERDVKLVPLVEPFIMTGDPLWNEAASQLHFTKDNRGANLRMQTWFGELSWLDFSSSPMRTWWRGKLGDFLDRFPFAGIWNDLNEPGDDDRTPLNALYWLDGAFGGFNPSDSRKWHLNLKNSYVVREASHTYETMLAKNTNARPFVLVRAGWPGVQKYALGWSGDNTASYDHLRHNIRLGVSVMMSGQVNYGHDIGGFIGDPDAELLTRWHEWGVLNPFCRNHSKKWDGMREPWRFPEPFRSHMKRSIQFRYELMPYLYTLAWRSTQDGMPMNSPTVMHFPNDTGTHANNDYDFMVGDSLLAAPVYAKGATNRWVYLPQGTAWYDWYTDRRHTGGWVSVAAPIGTLPLFAREGAIIPMGPAMRSVNEYQPARLDIEVWPSASSSFTLYEDDGETFDFTRGEFAKTRLESRRTATSWQFVIGAREGSYVPGSRALLVAAHDLPAVPQVRRNGAALAAAPNLAALLSGGDGWFYDAAARILSVKVADTGVATTIDASLAAPPLVTWIGNTRTSPGAGELDPGEPLTVSTETFAPGSAASAAVLWSTNAATWNAATMTFSGRVGPNDGWAATIGTFPAATVVRYAVAAVDANGSYVWDSRGGSNHEIRVTTPPALQWVGNTFTWPGSTVRSNEMIWINAESFPRTAGREAFVVFSVNGGAWQTRPLRVGTPVGNNDKWFLDFGQFPTGTQVRYAVMVRDAAGREIWDNNRGQDYRVAVN